MNQEELFWLKSFSKKYDVDFEELKNLTQEELDYVKSRSKKLNIPIDDFLEAYFLSKRIGSMAYLKLKLKGFKLN